MTIESLELKEKNTYHSGEELDSQLAKKEKSEMTIKELVTRFKQRPDSDELIARWRRPIPLK